ncbi:polysaccharide biosynthesis C-terminal domain-containing protein, partial [Peptostreptococcus porci]|uniref:polysaccharide biosynthesis C-terminal domain-containing protein n=2 Tax=Peptostreptococcus porci TaxID=2652282 RepID=UPI002A80B9B9
TMLLVLPCSFGLASLSVPISMLLFPKQPPMVVGLLLFVMAPACVFLGLLYTFNGILQGVGKPYVPVYALLSGIAAKIVISYVCTAIPSINILGSAFGTIMSYIIAAIIEYTYIKRFLKIEFDLMDYFVKPLITVIVMFVAAKYSYVGFNLILGVKLSTLLAIIVGGIVYIVVLLGIGGITKDEILAMPKGRSILKKLMKIKLVR